MISKPNFHINAFIIQYMSFSQLVIYTEIDDIDLEMITLQKKGECEVL